MKEKKQSIWLQFLISLGVGVSIALIYMLAAGVFQQSERPVILKILSDGFLLPAVVFLCIGGISFVSLYGFFDLLGYASFSFFGFFRLRHEDPDNPRPKDLYEYKVAKDERGRHWFPGVLLGSLFYILVSILFAVI